MAEKNAGSERRSEGGAERQDDERRCKRQLSKTKSKTALHYCSLHDFGLKIMVGSGNERKKRRKKKRKKKACTLVRMMMRRKEGGHDHVTRAIREDGGLIGLSRSARATRCDVSEREEDEMRAGCQQLCACLSQ